MRADAQRQQVFKEYAFTPHDESARKCFSTSLSNLVDSLSVCAGSDGVADLCHVVWVRILTLQKPAARTRTVNSCATRWSTVQSAPVLV